MTGHDDHIAPGDPRYDGFRIETLWAWTMIDPVDNQEGIVGIQTATGMMPLIASDRVRLDDLREHAAWIARRHGRQVWLRRFVADGPPLGVIDP